MVLDTGQFRSNLYEHFLEGLKNRGNTGEENSYFLSEFSLA